MSVWEVPCRQNGAGCSLIQVIVVRSPGPPRFFSCCAAAVRKERATRYGGAMKITILGVLLALCLAGPAHARGESTRWVTFKTARLRTYGPVLHQIDRTAIGQQGPYKTFSARIW